MKVRITRRTVLLIPGPMVVVLAVSLAITGCSKLTVLPVDHWAEEEWTQHYGQNVTLYTDETSYSLRITSVDPDYIHGTSKGRGERSSDPYSLIETTVDRADVHALGYTEVQKSSTFLVIFSIVAGLTLLSVAALFIGVE